MCEDKPKIFSKVMGFDSSHDNNQQWNVDDIKRTLLFDSSGKFRNNNKLSYNSPFIKNTFIESKKIEYGLGTSKPTPATQFSDFSLLKDSLNILHNENQRKMEFTEALY